MDWTAAIERQHKALTQIVAALAAMIAAAGFAGVDLAELARKALRLSGRPEAPTLPRHLHRAVMRILRPAESAARRLIIASARGISVTPPKPRPRKPPVPAIIWRYGYPMLNPAAPPPKPPVKRKPRLTLSLLDPKRRFGRRRRTVPRHLVPHICRTPGKTYLKPEPFDPIPLKGLALRLNALTAALGDMPGQARRYARWQARVSAEKARRKAAHARENTLAADVACRTYRDWPLRVGRAPGQMLSGGLLERQLLSGGRLKAREEKLHPVQLVLAEADWLARESRRPPHT